jgi:hypothetical protein
MAEELGGPFEKFLDSPYSKKRPSPQLHEIPIRSNKVRTHAPSTYWIGGWMGPRGGLDTVVEREIPSHCQETPAPDHPARS